MLVLLRSCSSRQGPGLLAEAVQKEVRRSFSSPREVLPLLSAERRDAPGSSAWSSVSSVAWAELQPCLKHLEIRLGK